MSAYEQSDLLVTSWSGAAFEYAMAFGKPVVHVDVPRKVRNPNYTDVPLEPFEVTHRGIFGVSVPEEEIINLGEYVVNALNHLNDESGNSEVRERPVTFSPGGGAKVAADYLLQLRVDN